MKREYDGIKRGVSREYPHCHEINGILSVEESFVLLKREYALWNFDVFFNLILAKSD